MTFGSKLQMLRKQRGFSQEELAAQLTISRQAISKWELGSAMPDTENIVQLSNLFGVSTDYLLKDDQESENFSDPIADKTKSTPTKENHFVPNIVIGGWATIGIGIIGVLIIGVLSSVYPAIIYDPPQGEIRSIIKTGLAAFLDFHNIKWLFCLFCVLILTGTSILIHQKYKKN